MRANYFNYLHYGGVLTREYLIDFWAQIEWSRLRYIHQNQVRLRAHNFTAVAEAAHAGRTANNSGFPIELPASFIGGNRNMAQLYQDAMAIVRRHGQPS